MTDHGRMLDEDRRATIAAAIRAKMLQVVARDLSVEDGVAAATDQVYDAFGGDASPRERSAAARRKRREAMMAELARLVAAGKGRSAATLVAWDFAQDPGDPVEVETLANALRRWRRKAGDARLRPRGQV